MASRALHPSATGSDLDDSLNLGLSLTHRHTVVRRLSASPNQLHGARDQLLRSIVSIRTRPQKLRQFHERGDVVRAGADRRTDPASPVDRRCVLVKGHKHASHRSTTISPLLHFPRQQESDPDAYQQRRRSNTNVVLHDGSLQRDGLGGKEGEIGAFRQFVAHALHTSGPTFAQTHLRFASPK